MIGIDTNILARFLAQDDAEQGQRADSLLQTLSPQDPGFVSLVSLIELAWVMRSRYRVSKSELIQNLERLLNSPELVIESQQTVAQAIARFGSAKTDFADCLIERSGHVAGCRHTVTFDENAAKTSGMKLL
ncbi:MAG: type II toxin-antitoxin system VapC family toxin [Terracidiphilus sp.]|jgi:predicted nucleic-acid-binding protein